MDFKTPNFPCHRFLIAATARHGCISRHCGSPKALAYRDRGCIIKRISVVIIHLLNKL